MHVLSVNLSVETVQNAACQMCRGVYLSVTDQPLLPDQVALLDVNEAAGKSLKECLDKQYGQDRTLFLSCDVESEQQFKGKETTTHPHTHKVRCR